MLILHVTSSQFCLYLLNIYHFTYTFSHAHTEKHTQAHMYNQHTRGMATTRHRNLVERGGRKALLETLHTPKKKNVRKNSILTNVKKRFEHIELPSKLLDYFLRSNKSNIINQDSIPTILFAGLPCNLVSLACPISSDLSIHGKCSEESLQEGTSTIGPLH